MLHIFSCITNVFSVLCCSNIHLTPPVFIGQTECYSETESESERSPSPRRRYKVSTVTGLHLHKHTHTPFGAPFTLLCVSYCPQKVQSHTLPRPKGKTNKVPLSNSSTEGSKGTGMYCLTLSTLTCCSLIFSLNDLFFNQSPSERFF